MALRLKLQISHRKSKYNSHCGVQKYSAQGHPFPSWVLSAGYLSARKEKKITCFSSSQMVSSDTLFLNFFTWLMLLLRTFLRASLDLLVDCLASLARLSLCSLAGINTHLGIGTRIIVPSTSGFRFMPLSLIAFVAAAVCGDFCEICPSWAPQKNQTQGKSYQPCDVLTLRFLLKSSFRASTTACMSSLVSSKLIISSTRAALIFTLA
uniref:Uncharacterized protein n=1 Tax=Buteo japonicus TaxID=224669 RepID=A0A8C0HNH0_9AVES